MSNKKVIIYTIIIIAIIIIIPTIYKIYENHNEKLLLVVEKEFSYYAKKCYYEDKCQSLVSLKDLYEAGYLEEKLTNPITKKYYRDDSTIDLNTNKIDLKS